MRNFDGIDGLVLCVIEGKKDIYKWISSIDALDHSIILYEELKGSVNNLLNGELIYLKRGRFVLSKTAKLILKGSFSMGAIEWQLKVQNRIKEYIYDEEKENSFDLSQEEYDFALKKYIDKTDKLLERILKL